jgi:hypothetical protein
VITSFCDDTSQNANTNSSTDSKDCERWKYNCVESGCVSVIGSISICILMFTCVCVCARACAFVCVCVDMLMSVFLYGRVCVCMHVLICVYLYVWMSPYMCAVSVCVWCVCLCMWMVACVYMSAHMCDSVYLYLCMP